MCSQHIEVKSLFNSVLLHYILRRCGHMHYLRHLLGLSSLADGFGRSHPEIKILVHRLNYIFRKITLGAFN